MPTPATTFYLTIQYDKVWIKFNGTNGGDKSRTVASIADLDAFLVSKANEAGVPVADLRVMCSSTLDFPTEYTSQPETLALARAIRGE